MTGRGWVVRGTQASRRFVASRVRPEGLTYNSCDAPPALGRKRPATIGGRYMDALAAVALAQHAAPLQL